ncbi:MarR family winged helix-turn-helix transcriptional regulator [Actinokineospora iranica]|uniref:DNA-binding transcriptional regulator, MarR family n=1 Tax=Actinokineospora iranica TaxID=1271860 RepID=A0A1G6U0P2_9PSEU|nr:MarR family transcriptional regulator [Actinokineospora iranica]SDD34883.1 DNA-binding transcriptional regulator, MarR family [Actinokineospora iranica]
MVAEDADLPLVQGWRELLTVHARTWCALDRELARHGLSASEFEILDRLVEAEGADARVQDLAAAAHLSQSAVSRLIGRLERDGLVARAMCVQDRRGIQVCLTPAGHARHAEALSTHRAVLAEMMTAPDPGPPQ